MFSLVKKYSFLQKIIFAVIIICACTMLAKAQTVQPEKNPVEIAAKKSSGKVMEIAKLYVQEQVRLKETPKEEANDEGVLSAVNKTIEELERRAERQYQNNRVISIKDDLE